MRTIAADGGPSSSAPSRGSLTEGVADLGNVKLWYWDTGGAGAVIVLLHPGSGSAEFYPDQQAAFARAGYRVVSYSRRNQNRSGKGDDFETYYAADDLLHLLDRLKVDKCHVVGNALGGYVALDFALSHPERVSSLVLACSMMGITEPDFRQALQEGRPPGFASKPAEEKELGSAYRAGNPAGAAEWKRRHERAGPSAPVRLRNEITWPVLSRLKVPALLITGDEDVWMPPAVLRQAAEKIPNSQVVIVPGAGHAVQWEQPAVFNQAVLEFVRGASKR